MKFFKETIMSITQASFVNEMHVFIYSSIKFSFNEVAAIGESSAITSKVALFLLPKLGPSSIGQTPTYFPDNFHILLQNGLIF